MIRKLASMIEKIPSDYEFQWRRIGTPRVEQGIKEGKAHVFDGSVFLQCRILLKKSKIVFIFIYEVMRGLIKVKLAELPDPIIVSDVLMAMKRIEEGSL